MCKQSSRTLARVFGRKARGSQCKFPPQPNTPADRQIAQLDKRQTWFHAIWWNRDVCYETRYVATIFTPTSWCLRQRCFHPSLMTILYHESAIHYSVHDCLCSNVDNIYTGQVNTFLMSFEEQHMVNSTEGIPSLYTLFSILTWKDYEEKTWEGFP